MMPHCIVCIELGNFINWSNRVENYMKATYSNEELEPDFVICWQLSSITLNSSASHMGTLRKFRHAHLWYWHEIQTAMSPGSCMLEPSLQPSHLIIKVELVFFPFSFKPFFNQFQRLPCSPEKFQKISFCNKLFITS